jgi:hypothetical protein
MLIVHDKVLHQMAITLQTLKSLRPTPVAFARLFGSPIAKKVPARICTKSPLIRSSQIGKEIPAAAGSKLFYINTNPLSADYRSHAIRFM